MTKTIKLSDLRHEPSQELTDPQLPGLEFSNTADNPFDQLDLWLNQAIQALFFQPNAMVLSTMDSKTHQPSSRVVLLKDFNQKDGLIFYTHYQSRKSQELELNPQASALFYWDKLERQVRIEGKIQKISDLISDQYFQSRPRESQIGASISPQSQIIPDRDFLIQAYQKLENNLNNQTIPRPDYWGGYQLIPSYFEFWQGRNSRLHDRIIYKNNNSNKDKNTWLKSRLAP